ncbi:glycine betaine uptake BCCT transporter [Oceanobacillus oncorhynchi]|uniref:glycine betaine uptake BCCT transporter n=1 Tax=Oceanobacillus oncorhynchi TaxID=545501 RepID=UPI0021161CCA|nr:BCCT family transporter [Oceanobacillus oncorhynchi]UUI38738.1 BCCT family transporter [Oceanobacillus oncorhynchi]
MKKVTKVFWISSAIVLLFILWGIIPPSVLPTANLDNVTGTIQAFIVNHFSWYYLIVTTIFIGVAFFLIFSKYGTIKLGKPEDKPEFNYISWFAMLFSAGMGIGLVFWGTAEPVLHLFDSAPYGELGTTETAAVAMQYSFFHWGFHPWGIYAIVGLALAYFKFRHNSSGLVSSILVPLFGDKVKGGWGTAIDTLVVFATVFGVATSLGFGAIQISGGLAYVFNLDSGIMLQLIVIIVVTILFIISTLSGINKGIKVLSNANIVLAIALMLFLLFVGPTDYILSLFTNTAGNYIQNLPSMSLRLDAFDTGNTEWINDWTIFYWAWWLAWAPFVGTFIARVSRGRTIREFVIGVLLVPTIFGALWFTVYGGTAMYFDLQGTTNIASEISQYGEEVALFSLLENFPFGTVLSLISILLIAIFFITSADSATFVLGMQTTGGSLYPPYQVKLVWGIVQSATAAVLLWQGGLGALQTASIIAALPFSVIMILIVLSLVKTLKLDAADIERRRRKQLQNKT